MSQNSERLTKKWWAHSTIRNSKASPNVLRVLFKKPIRKFKIIPFKFI